MAYSFAKSGLKISKDRNKALQQDLNRAASNEQRRLERRVEVEKEISEINIALNGMGSSIKADTPELRMALNERLVELKEKLAKMLVPANKPKVKRRVLMSLPNGMQRTNGDSQRPSKITTVTRDDSDDVVVKEALPSYTGNRVKSNERTATISKVGKGKTCKSDKNVRGKRMITGKMTSKQARELVFNDRTDIPKNSELRHMSNSEYVRFINAPEREAQISQVMAQPEKGSTKKQGGSPNSGFKPRFILNPERTRLIKACVVFKPMGNI